MARRLFERVTALRLSSKKMKFFFKRYAPLRLLAPPYAHRHAPKPRPLTHPRTPSHTLAHPHTPSHTLTHPHAHTLSPPCIPLHPLTSAYTHPHLLLRPLTRYLSYARAAADHELVEHVKEKARAWVESAAAQE